MSEQVLRMVLRSVVERLARGEYQALVAESSASRMTVAELGDAVNDYRRTLVIPPEAAYQTLNTVQVRGTSSPTWSVRFPMWTREEGKSDLTLELTVVVNEGGARFELDDLHVL
jgi:hypothetical protein